MFYTWLIIVILLAILEICTTALVSIWFVFSGLIAMLLSLFVDNIYIEIATFIIFGTIFMIFTKNITKKMNTNIKQTNFDRIIGMNGIVTEKITKNNSGEVKVDGKKWSAVANKTINVGTNVKIININSTKLTVEEMEE